jgi:hypothetical protein
MVDIRRLYACMFFRSRETRESKLRRGADDLAVCYSGDVPAYRSAIDVCLNNLDSDHPDSSSGMNPYLDCVAHAASELNLELCQLS